MTAEKNKKHGVLKDKSPYFLNIRHFWQTFSKVITSLCFIAPLNKSRSSPGYTLELCIPCWLHGIRLFFLMSSSISNSLKWLFYLMLFPYSSLSGASREDEGRWSPLMDVQLCACVCPPETPGAPVDCGSVSTGAMSSSFSQFDCWRTGAVIGCAHTPSPH